MRIDWLVGGLVGWWICWSGWDSVCEWVDWLVSCLLSGLIRWFIVGLLSDLTGWLTGGFVLCRFGCLAVLSVGWLFGVRVGRFVVLKPGGLLACLLA